MTPEQQVLALLGVIFIIACPILTVAIQSSWSKLNEKENPLLGVLQKMSDASQTISGAMESMDYNARLHSEILVEERDLLKRLREENTNKHADISEKAALESGVVKGKLDRLLDRPANGKQ